MTPGAIHPGTPVIEVASGVWAERSTPRDPVILHATSRDVLVRIAAALGFRADPKRHTNGMYTTFFTRAKADRAIGLAKAYALPLVDAGAAAHQGWWPTTTANDGGRR